MSRHLFFLSLTVAVGCGLSRPATAASAIAFGNRTARVTFDAPSREAAVQESLEKCSRLDSHCRILLKCKEPGYGAVSLSRHNGLIASIGAACAEDNADTAVEKSLQRCEDHADRGRCSTDVKWLDPED